MKRKKFFSVTNICGCVYCDIFSDEVHLSVCRFQLQKPLKRLTVSLAHGSTPEVGFYFIRSSGEGAAPPAPRARRCVLTRRSRELLTSEVNSSAKHRHGRAIAQAVSRWLPTAADRVRARLWSSGICGGQSDAGAGFLRVLRFPLPIFIPPNSPSS
jgi:hypothetical protein